MSFEWLQTLIDALTALVGARWAYAIVSLGLIELVLVLFLPWLAFLVYRQGIRHRLKCQDLEESLAKTQESLYEIKTAVSEIMLRIGALDTTVRFGPHPKESGRTSAGNTGNEETDLQGKGVYNFCPSCKVIRFIKFSRCQTCGYHVS